MAPVLLPALMFVLGTAVVFGLYALVTWLPDALTRRRIAQRMTDVSRPGADVPVSADVAATVVKRQVMGVAPGLDRIAVRTTWGLSLARLIEQAGARVGVSSIVLACLGSAAFCGMCAVVALRESWAFFPGAGAGLALPILVLFRKRRTRLHRFEEQFPEALDLLSRAIRAGHAFTTAVGMVADEAPDPIGPEFRKTFDEQNFGLPLKDALFNLGERVPIMDVRFFVTAVLIQRETGGNLSEILDNLSRVVRERFKILRQVRVYTAHGRLTGYVLMALPAALALTLSFINPEHIDVLFTERMGRMMIALSIALQVTGYLWIRKVVKIEV